MSACKHEDFTAHVDVHPIQQEATGPVVMFMIDLKVECAKCGQELEFVGMPLGCSFYHPTVSINGQECRLPLVIPGTEPPPGMAGFSVTQQVFDEKKAVTQ